MRRPAKKMLDKTTAGEILQSKDLAVRVPESNANFFTLSVRRIDGQYAEKCVRLNMPCRGSERKRRRRRLKAGQEVRQGSVEPGFAHVAHDCQGGPGC